ncbi:hypothetical protein ACHAPD_006062 [Fusarium lateritium]
MRTSTVLTIANFGTAFAAVQVYNQCGGSAYSGDKECPSGSTCVEASKWFPGFPAPPQAPSIEGDNNQSGDDVSTPFPPTVPAPEEPVETVIADPTVAPTSAPLETGSGPGFGSGSGSGSGSGGIMRPIPASSGATAVATAIPVSGELDGGMTYEADAMFILEDGATLHNVIICSGQAEGVHCKGTCTLENVWFEDVCEDAISLKQRSGTSIIRGGGAFHAADKVIQFNDRGTVEISDFYVEDYGKPVRSCGNCKDNGGPRNVVIENIAAVNGGVLCGINTNYGDTCTISNACQDEGKNCDLFEGNSDGSEPTKLSSGLDGTSCKADSFAETC